MRAWSSRLTVLPYLTEYNVKGCKSCRGGTRKVTLISNLALYDVSSDHNHLHRPIGFVPRVHSARE